MKYSTFCYLLILLCLTATNAIAQDTITRPKSPVSGFIPYFGGEFLATDLNSLNSKLDQYGYINYNRSLVGFTGGFSSIFSNFHMGISFTSYLAKTTNQNGFNVRIQAGNWMVTPGYLLLQSNKTFLFGTVGIGADNIDIQIQETSDVAFDSVLNNPRQVGFLKSETYMVRPGLMAYFFFGGADGEYGQNTGGLGLMAEIGYSFTVGNTNWTMVDRNVTDGPNAGLGGPYVRLALAMGGISRRR